MPIYEYKCSKCGLRFEVRQGFNDKPVEHCQNPDCNGKVHRVFSPPAIIFKGSGFHVNDYGRGNHKPSKDDHAQETPTEAKAPEPASSRD